MVARWQEDRDEPGGESPTSQRPFNCGIEVIDEQNGAWSAPSTVVPIQSGLNRFNPDFVPDSSFVVYSESTCPNNQNTNGQCDGDDDPSTKTWAVQAQAGATPVLLANAAGPGAEDGNDTDLHDTFPRSSPFEAAYDNGKVYWVTISSRL